VSFTTFRRRETLFEILFEVTTSKIGLGIEIWLFTVILGWRWMPSRLSYTDLPEKCVNCRVEIDKDLEYEAYYCWCSGFNQPICSERCRGMLHAHAGKSQWTLSQDPCCTRKDEIEVFNASTGERVKTNATEVAQALGA